MAMSRHGVPEREAIALIASGNATDFEVLQLSESGHWVIQFELRIRASAVGEAAVLQAKRGQTRVFKRITGAISWLMKAKVANARIQLCGGVGPE